MQKLAVVVGFGGINCAGRSSGHHAFKRVVLESLSATQQQDTLKALAQLMGLNPTPADLVHWRQRIEQGTLVRGFDNIDFDANAVPMHQPFTDEQGVACWRLSHKRLAVQSAGQLPQGFDPAATYPSHHHPRGLQMTVLGMSDALGQLGVEWQQLQDHVRPDEIAVYAGSAMGQLDSLGTGGLLQAPLLGKRASSKQCALGFSEMPADFINAYILGNVGATGSMGGACASFLYNLKLGLDDIRSGRRRLVVVGNSEAPIVAEVIEGYSAMTALVTEQNLRKLDGLSATAAVDYQRASRPFGQNAGFSIAESAQFFILCDDELAVELGLTIYASAGEVFVHADGFKRSISNPGIGNYLTLGKALGAAKRQLGEAALQHSFVHAHGSSTPANRTTESRILSELAGAFGIQHWPVCAVKAQLGHSISAAAADQLLCSLGSWALDVLPGITTTSALADDVEQKHLNFLLQHQTFAGAQTPLAFLNAKGFGGNNASAYFISPQHSLALLKTKYSAQQWQQYWHKNDAVQAASQQWDQDCSAGKSSVIYKFGEGVLEPQDLHISATGIELKSWRQPVLW